MLPLVVLLIVDLGCLAFYLWFLEWMFRRGWWLWPRVFALGWALFTTILCFGFSDLTDAGAHVAALLGGAVTVAPMILFLQPALQRGKGPITAWRDGLAMAGKLFDVLGKRAYLLVTVAPGVGVGLSLIWLGVAESTAANIGGGVAAVCWALFPSSWRVALQFGWRRWQDRRRDPAPAMDDRGEDPVEPTTPPPYQPNIVHLYHKSVKSFRTDYGSIGHIRATATRPVLVLLAAAVLAVAALAYVFHAEMSGLPPLLAAVLYGGGGALLVWRLFLRPVRTDDDDPASAVTAWRAAALREEAAPAEPQPSLPLPASAESAAGPRSLRW